MWHGEMNGGYAGVGEGGGMNATLQKPPSRAKIGEVPDSERLGNLLSISEESTERLATRAKIRPLIIGSSSHNGRPNYYHRSKSANDRNRQRTNLLGKNLDDAAPKPLIANPTHPILRHQHMSIPAPIASRQPIA